MSGGYIYMLGSPGFGRRKGPNSMGKTSTLGVLRLRATKCFVTR